MKNLTCVNALFIVTMVVMGSESHAQTLEVINTGLGFAESYVTADSCLNANEKTRGAAVGGLPLLLGFGIGLPAALMTDSAKTGFIWGAAAAGLAQAGIASAGIAKGRKLEDEASQPATWVRKRDFALCKIMQNRRERLQLVLENLQDQVSPPCIYTVASGQDYRNDVVRNGSDFLRQINACTQQNPEVSPNLAEAVNSIAELNHDVCLQARQVVNRYDNKIQQDAVKQQGSFINHVQASCERDNDYQYYGTAQ